MERLSLRSVTTQAEVNFAHVLNGIKQELPLEYRQRLPACAVHFGTADDPVLLLSSVVKLLKILQESACDHL